MSEDTKALVAIVVLSGLLFGFWLTVAAMTNWSTVPTIEHVRAPPGFELECVDNPTQIMICKAYCGQDYPRPERPHP